jgi:hypothetical protein
MPRASKSKELSVKLGNNIGTGASLFSKLKDAGINVVASCCYQIAEEALFTIVPDDAAAAERVLREAGIDPLAQDVLLVELTDEVGAFAAVLQEISRLRVNVRSAYATTGPATSARAVIKTENDDRVLAELNAS